MEQLNFKNLALTMLGIVKDSGAVTVISQNLVQSSNDPSVTQYKIDYWPVQLTFRTSGDKKIGIGKYFEEQIDGQMKGVYPDMMAALRAAEHNVLAVMTVNWKMNEAGPENKSQLMLTNALSGDKAIVKVPCAINASSPSVGPNIVFDWIEYQTEYSLFECTGMLITAVKIEIP